MRLTGLDWAVIAAYFVVNLAIGLYYRKRAGSSTGEFFLSGRSVPWWLAGTSMVATTFAADTPLAVTGITATNGIGGNWLWWSFLLSGMMTVFFFARLWRRAEVVTDLELVELRYSGRPAAILRGFRSLYLGVLMNCIIMGWVNLAMVKIMMLTLGFEPRRLVVGAYAFDLSPKAQAMLVCLVIIGGYTAAYTTMSGLWGVLVTDLFQFVLKMSMVIALAYFSVKAVGGIALMKVKLLEVDAARGAASGGHGSILSFVPDLGSPWMPMLAFFVYIGVNWWATWYPGAEPGGGGYVAQRIFCAKNEKHSLLATLWFNLAHYALRTWPWVLTALATVILYPHLQDRESGYVRALVDVLPASLRGLMLAAFLAAYMSTIGTQLNWGSSYLVNDFYRRFLKRGASDRHYVSVSKVATVLLMIISAAVSLRLESIAGAWKLVIAAGAGTGSVYLLRWYWWRINAWSEIAAMAAALVSALAVDYRFQCFTGRDVPAALFSKGMLAVVAITTVVWLLTTFLTAPEPREVLVSFYRRVRPSYAFWKPIAQLAPEVPPVHDVWYNLGDFIAGCVLVYGAMFGIGKTLLGFFGQGIFYLALAVVASGYIWWDFSRRGWEALAGEAPGKAKGV